MHDTHRATWRISLHLTAHQLVTAAGVASLGVLARERDGVVQRAWQFRWEEGQSVSFTCTVKCPLRFEHEDYQANRRCWGPKPS